MNLGVASTSFMAFQVWTVGHKAMDSLVKQGWTWTWSWEAFSQVFTSINGKDYADLGVMLVVTVVLYFNGIKILR